MSRFYEEVVFIGKVHSDLKHQSSCPKMEYENAPPAVIEIFSEYSEAISSIDVGNDILILTWLHKAKRDIMKVHPRGNIENPLTGVFSTRSPERPNPIGVHRVRITSIESETLFYVESLDVLNETPILDIKQG